MKRGFTLVELLLYMVILGTMLAVLSSFVFMTYQAKIKSQSVAEVEQQGNQIMDIMLQTIRNSALINTPVSQASGATLSLNTYSGGTTPTVFDLNSSNIRITEGVSATVNLTSGRVIASALTFTNVTEAAAPGVVRVQFTLTRANIAGTNEYDYTKTFYGTATVRP